MEAIMDRKLIAIDLDGTTLNNDRLIDDYTKKIITQVRQLGHVVMIATGRPYRTSKQYYDFLDLDSPMVNFNGALCHHPSNPQWDNAYERTLPADVVNEMFRLRSNKKINLISAEVDGQIYTSSNYIPYEDFFPNGPENAVHFEDNQIDEEATAVNIFTDSKYLQNQLEKELLKEYGNFIEVRTWGGFAPCIEVVSIGTQKAMGVEHVADYYGIPAKDVLAFGDEDNDYEMIQYAGHGVAMRNAIMPLKDIANDVTEYNNDNQGLARYLADYFNL